VKSEGAPDVEKRDCDLVHSFTLGGGLRLSSHSGTFEAAMKHPRKGGHRIQRESTKRQRVFLNAGSCDMMDEDAQPVRERGKKERAT